jgi:hypothetical protein
VTALRILGRIVYWLVVIAISVLLLVLLVRFFESRDESQVDGAAVPVALARAG